MKNFITHHIMCQPISLLLQKQLFSILRIVKLEHEGHILRVSAVRRRSNYFLRAKSQTKVMEEKEYPNFHLDSKDVCRFEPRLELIRKQLLSILNHFEIIVDGGSITPDAFVLKDMRHWISGLETDGRLGDPYYDILKYLSWPCRNDCSFCLHKGDPPGCFSKSRKGWRTSEEEIISRLKYWLPNENRALFSKYDLNYFEITSHPNFFTIAKATRQKSKHLITIVTSGSNLTREIVDGLNSLKPLLLVISLNTSNRNTRSLIMRDPTPDIAIKSLYHLSKKKIPFVVSQTIFPDFKIRDFKRTIQFAEEFSPYLIRVSLGAFTKHHPNRQWDSRKVWESWFKGVDTIRKLRRAISTPIIVQPAMFEECFFQKEQDFPVLEGVVRNSPAFSAGIKADDKIVSICDTEVLSNRFARYLLRMLALREVGKFDIEIIRENTKYRVTIDVYDTCYPYIQYSKQAPIFYPFGMVLRDSLDPLDVLKVRELAIKNKSENTLLLSSILVRPSLIRQLKNLGIGQEDGLNVHIEVPQNTNFLGGDIIIGDLLVVDDFVDSIRNFIDTNKVRPDLVIIPSSPFSRWGRDIQGKNRTEINRSTGIPVVFLNNQEILAMG